MPTEQAQNSEASRRRKKRFIFGIFVLLLVDIIWVGSAEVSEEIFHECEFNKPFFTTYFKTSMFVVYLFGFLFMKRWHYQCRHSFTNSKTSKRILQEVERVSRRENEKIAGSMLSASENASRCSTPGNFTPPRYENMTDDDISLTESEDVQDRKVSFNHVREVRSLADKHLEAQVLARMSQNSIDELRLLLTVVTKKLSLLDTMKLSIIFVVLWTFATLMYQEALAHTSAAVTNILSSTSGIFTLLLAAVFPCSTTDKFSVSKLLAVLLSFSGIVLVCWADPSRGETKLNLGEIYALLGAFLYACYLVMLRRKVGDEDKLDIPLFFGFVGLFGALLFWPGFFILHYAEQEVFELPHTRKTWGYLVLNAVVGTVLSELLWLWGCFLTSSLMATLSLGLVIPLTMAWDMTINKMKFSWLFIVGVIPVFVAFVAVSVLTHFGEWDPVKDLFSKLFCYAKRSNPGEESKSLLHDSSSERKITEQHPVN